MKRLSLLLLAMVFATVTSFAQRVIGYYAGWEQAYASVQYDKLTDINYAFAEPKSNHTVGFSDSYQLGLFETFINYVKYQQTLNPNIRVNLSIGGASDALAAQFKTTGSNNTSAATFARSCVDFALQYGLDGIDIDWEPVPSGSATAFTNIMRELREEIDARAPQLQLSAAVFPEGFVGTQGIPNAGVTSSSFQYADFFCLMAYDYGTPDFENHSPDRFTETIQYWEGKGLEKSKMVFGLPFYARSRYWAYSRNDQTPYRNLVSQYGGSTAAGSNALGNWRYNGQAMITTKTNKAIDAGLKGVMIWEISQDVAGQYSLLKAIDDAITTAGCQKPELGDAQIICGQNSITLNAGLSDVSYVWKKNNQVIGGATSSTYTATTGGTYEVEATKNGTTCTKTDIVSIIDNFDAPDLGNGVPLCGGETVEIDADVNIPGLNYIWKRGTQTVSTDALLSFNTVGTYVVTISDPGGNCPDQTASIEASPSALSIEGDEICAGNEANLIINSTGGPYSWFEQENGGQLIHVGNEYNVSPSSTKTYYVQNTGGSQTEYLGLATQEAPITQQSDPDWTGSAYITYQPEFVMEITVNQALTIDSVTVFPDWSLGETSFDIELLSAGGALSQPINANVFNVDTAITLSYEADGGAGVPIRFKLGMSIKTPGTYYLRINNTGGPVIFLDQMNKENFGTPGYEALPYPYAFGNIMSINTSYSWGGWEDRRTYAGIYNWRVSTGATCPRVPVTATVNNCAPPSVAISASKTQEVLAGEGAETVTITAAGSDTDGEVAGMTITQDGNVVQEGVQNDGNGTYTVDLQFAEEGTYEICATAVDNDGLSSSESCVSIATIVTGLGDNIEDNISIFPNPFTETATIEVEESLNSQVNIYNMSGVLLETSNSTSIGSNLEKGVYMIEVITNRGVVTKKVIKE